jgi:four helix bundle protein
MFAHESTPVYQQALDFAKWCEPMLDRTPKQTAMHAQLDNARTTILLKVAAGASRPARDEKNFEAAQTAAIECAACLDLLFNKRVVSRDELQRGKESLQKLIALLGVNSFAPEPRARAA